MGELRNETYIEVEYKGRLFGDVLREMIYSIGEDTYSFVRVSGITNVMLSNFLNHKRYPGIDTLRKVAVFLREAERNEFVTYFKNPDTKKQAMKILEEKGMDYPYAYSGHYDKDKIHSIMYGEVNRYNLESLKLQGLFKYLSAEEKAIFKEKIITYIVERNISIIKAVDMEIEIESV